MRLEVNFVWEGRIEKHFEKRLSDKYFFSPGWSTSKTLGMLSSESKKVRWKKAHLLCFFFRCFGKRAKSSKRRKRRWSSVCRSQATPPWRRCPQHSYGAPWDSSSQVWGVKYVKRGGEILCYKKSWFFSPWNRSGIDLIFCWLQLWRHSSRFLCLHSKLLFPGLT